MMNDLRQEGHAHEYGNIEQLRKQLVNKRVVDWNEDTLTLDDGTVVSIECSEQECCAGGWGTFSNVKLDTLITDVSLPYILENDCCEPHNYGVIKMFHNQTIVAQADCEASHNGYYYAITSLVIKDVHCQVVDV